ncbi:MAG: hypothetical protein JKY37_02580 [Nannocystaceae bacterium]|nr:hypothetical protein [Nannocystaceae bacterium]
MEANCEGAPFDEPTLRSTDSLAPLVAIPPAYLDGSGLFTGESLDHDLRNDACEAFAEDLCSARLQRPSPAGEPLHLGEQWLVNIAGQMQADSSYAPAIAAADIAGTLGYSRCEGGSGSGPCPMYLGSMHVELLEPLEIELTCGGVAQAHELSSLTIDLVQPAFGISETGSVWSGNAFPPGGLVIAAQGVVDEVPFSMQRPIERPVSFIAEDGFVSLLGTGGFKVDFAVPCNGEFADLDVWWGLADDGVIEGPPTLSIDQLPQAIACPGELALTLTWSADPDGDYESLRWIVDGVLLEETWPTIAFTEPHEVKAVLRDSRGATATATKTIVCQ